MEILKKRLSGMSGGRILDVATGGGSFIKLLAEGFGSFDKIIGVDSCEPGKLEEAQKKFPDERIRLMSMQGEDLTFEDGHFDTVCISNSLHHLNDANMVLQEMKRVLKPGGLLIINEMYCDNQKEPQKTHVHMHHWWADIDSRLGISHHHTFRRQEIVSLLEEAGIEVKEVYDYTEPEADCRNEAELEQLDGVIDTYMQKAQGLPDYETLRTRGEELRIRLKDVGIAGATQLIIIGTKQ